nr:hypothetical protein VCHA53O474_250028 [Vibrio chagasii]
MDTNKTIRDVLPEEFFDEFKDSPANKHLEQKVVGTKTRQEVGHSR